MKTPVISFYSDIDGRTYYSDHATRLKKSLDQLNTPSHIRHKPSKGSYRSNCLSKPRFICEMMNELREPLVWLDVDTIVHKELVVFDQIRDSVDLAFAMPKIPTKEDNTIAYPKASPIFLAQTPKAYEFIYAWIEASEHVERNAKVAFDHEILIQIFTKMLNENTGVRMGFLGIPYCMWPGKDVEGIDPYITMGLADGESKSSVLKTMGYDEESIKFQSPGNKFLVNK